MQCISSSNNNGTEHGRLCGTTIADLTFCLRGRRRRTIWRAKPKFITKKKNHRQHSASAGLEICNGVSGFLWSFSRRQTPPPTTTHPCCSTWIPHFGLFSSQWLDGRPPLAVQQSIIDCIHILIKKREKDFSIGSHHTFKDFESIGKLTTEQITLGFWDRKCSGSSIEWRRVKESSSMNLSE